MTNNNNSNISNEHINALLNIFHNNGDINLSPYEEHLNFDGILSAEDNPNIETKETDTLTTSGQNEQSYTIEETNNPSILDNTKNKETIQEIISGLPNNTNDDDKKPPLSIKNPPLSTIIITLTTTTTG